MTLGERIILSRVGAGFLTGTRLAKAASPHAEKWGRPAMTRQYLNNLERDKVRKPDPVLLAAIAKTTNVDLQWLATGEAAA